MKTKEQTPANSLSISQVLRDKEKIKKLHANVSQDGQEKFITQFKSFLGDEHRPENFDKQRAITLMELISDKNLVKEELKKAITRFAADNDYISAARAAEVIGDNALAVRYWIRGGWDFEKVGDDKVLRKVIEENLPNVLRNERFGYAADLYKYLADYPNALKFYIKSTDQQSFKRAMEMALKADPSAAKKIINQELPKIDLEFITIREGAADLALLVCNYPLAARLWIEYLEYQNAKDAADRSQDKGLLKRLVYSKVAQILNEEQYGTISKGSMDYAFIKDALSDFKNYTKLIKIQLKNGLYDDAIKSADEVAEVDKFSSILQKTIHELIAKSEQKMDQVEDATAQRWRIKYLASAQKLNSYLIKRMKR